MCALPFPCRVQQGEDLQCAALILAVDRTASVARRAAAAEAARVRAADDLRKLVLDVQLDASEVERLETGPDTIEVCVHMVVCMRIIARAQDGCV